MQQDCRLGSNSQFWLVQMQQAATPSISSEECLNNLQKLKQSHPEFVCESFFAIPQRDLSVDCTDYKVKVFLNDIFVNKEQAPLNGNYVLWMLPNGGELLATSGAKEFAKVADASENLINANAIFEHGNLKRIADCKSITPTQNELLGQIELIKFIKCLSKHINLENVECVRNSRLRYIIMDKKAPDSYQPTLKMDIAYLMLFPQLELPYNHVCSLSSEEAQTLLKQQLWSNAWLLRFSYTEFSYVISIRNKKGEIENKVATLEEIEKTLKERGLPVFPMSEVDSLRKEWIAKNELIAKTVKLYGS